MLSERKKEKKQKCSFVPGIISFFKCLEVDCGGCFGVSPLAVLWGTTSAHYMQPAGQRRAVKAANPGNNTLFGKKNMSLRQKEQGYTAI